MKFFKFLKSKIGVFTLLVIVFFSFGFAGKCGIKELDRNRSEQEKAEFYARLHIEMPRYESLIKSNTPKGAYIFSQDPIPAEARAAQFAAVDQGIDRFLQTTADKNWTNMRIHSDFAIVMIRPTYTVKEGLDKDAGALTLRDGTTTAGTLVSIPLKDKSVTHVAVIAQNWDRPDSTRRAVRNENEHLGAISNSPEEFGRQRLDDRHPFYSDEKELEWELSSVLPVESVSVFKRIFNF